MSFLHYNIFYRFGKDGLLVTSSKETNKKRSRQPEKWKMNKRKKLCQSGESYVSSTKKIISSKKILKTCKENCKYKCNAKLTFEQRIFIKQSYYNMDKDRQNFFIVSSTRCNITARQTKKGFSKRHYSFQYFFVEANEEIRVCKTFWIQTLCISQKIIYNVHEKKDPLTGTPKADMRDKHTKRVVTDEIKNKVNHFISSFPTVDSHYCRSSSTRQYLPSNLNLKKMYQLYIEMNSEEEAKKVKES